MNVKIRLLHNCSIPGARWCEPVGWEPANEVEDAEWMDGVWWGPQEEEAALAWFGHPDQYGAREVVEVPLDDLRVVRSGDCRVIGPVEPSPADGDRSGPSREL